MLETVETVETVVVALFSHLNPSKDYIGVVEVCRGSLQLPRLNNNNDLEQDSDRLHILAHPSAQLCFVSPSPMGDCFHIDI